MGNYGSKDVGFIIVDAYDLTSVVLNLNDPSVEEVLDDVTPFGVAFPRVLDTGFAQADGPLKLETLYDTTTGLSNTVFTAQQGVRRVIVWAVEGNAVGKRFQGYAGAVETKPTRVSTAGKLHRENVEFKPSGEIDTGVILHPLQAEVAAGNTQSTPHDWAGDRRAKVVPIASASAANPTILTFTAPIDQGLSPFLSGDTVVIAGSDKAALNGSRVLTVIDALHASVPVDLTAGAGTGGTATQASTTGGAGYFACTALTLGGYDSFQAKVRHSADNATYADLLTFAAITVPGAERKTVATAVNRYVAASYALAGAGAGPSATFVVGFARNAGQ